MLGNLPLTIYRSYINAITDIFPNISVKSPYLVKLDLLLSFRKTGSNTSFNCKSQITLSEENILQPS